MTNQLSVQNRRYGTSGRAPVPILKLLNIKQAFTPVFPEPEEEDLDERMQQQIADDAYPNEPELGLQTMLQYRNLRRSWDQEKERVDAERMEAVAKAPHHGCVAAEHESGICKEREMNRNSKMQGVGFVPQDEEWDAGALRGPVPIKEAMVPGGDLETAWSRGA